MSNRNFQMLTFSSNFGPIKTDMSGNTAWPQLSYFQKLTILGIFHQLLSTQNVNIVKWDFLDNFWILCFLIWKMFRLAALMASIRRPQKTYCERTAASAMSPAFSSKAQPNVAQNHCFSFSCFFNTFLMRSFVLPCFGFGDEQVQEVTCLLQCFTTASALDTVQRVSGFFWKCIFSCSTNDSQYGKFD